MMGVPIKKLCVTDEQAKQIIRSALGDKFTGELPQGFNMGRWRP